MGRKFGGSYYAKVRGLNNANKSDARAAAEALRESGSRARIVKGSKGWNVYSK